MDDQTRNDIHAFFQNQKIQDALSRMGLFAIDYVNKRAFPSSFWVNCGYSSDEMVQAILPQILHPDDRERVLQQSEDLFQGKTDNLTDVFRIRNKSGAWVWVASSYTVIYRDDQGTPLLYVGHDQDITEIKYREEQSLLRVKEIETLRQVIADVNSSLDLRETVSLILEHTRRVIPYDKSTVQLLEDGYRKVIGCVGFSDEEAIKALRFPHPIEGSPATLAILSRNPMVCNDIEGNFPDFRQIEGEEPTRSWLGIPLIANNEVIGLLALDSVVADFYDERHRTMAEAIAGHVALAVDKARLFERVQTMALTDNLTGGGNRHSLQVHGAFFLEKAKREKKRLIVLMVDFDHFKKVNDTFGHDVGDTVLREGAALIRTCLRTYDLFVRYGGEEFVVFLPESTPGAAWSVAERIRQTVAGHHFSDLNRPQTVSIGLGSVIPSGAMELSDVIKLADAALYEAKTSGRNQTRSTIL